VIQQGRTSVPAGTSNNNFWSGTPYEFIPVLSTIQFGFTTGDLAAITIGDIEVDVICGGEAIALNTLPTALGVTPRMPIYPDDFQLSGICAAGDRLIGKVRNLDAANAAFLYWSIILDPL
jgi:hypothetical protein